MKTLNKEYQTWLVSMSNDVERASKRFEMSDIEIVMDLLTIQVPPDTLIDITFRKRRGK